MCTLSFLTLHPYHYHNTWKNTGMQLWAPERAVRHFERCDHHYLSYASCRATFLLNLATVFFTEILCMHWWAIPAFSLFKLISLVSFDQTAICALLRLPWRNHARCTLIKGDLSPWAWTIYDCGWLWSFGLLCWRKQPDNKPATL